MAVASWYRSVRRCTGSHTMSLRERPKLLMEVHVGDEGEGDGCGREEKIHESLLGRWVERTEGSK